MSKHPSYPAVTLNVMGTALLKRSGKQYRADEQLMHFKTSDIKKALSTNV